MPESCKNKPRRLWAVKHGVENANVGVAPRSWGIFFPRNTAAECRGYNLQLLEMRPASGYWPRASHPVTS